MIIISFNNSLLVMKCLMRFLMTQNISTFKSFLRNWINPGRSNPKQKTRKKVIVNNAASKLLNGKMEKLEDEYN